MCDHFFRCIPDKETETCYYLDPAPVFESKLTKEQRETLELIPDAPKGVNMD